MMPIASSSSPRRKPALHVNTQDAYGTFGRDSDESASPVPIRLSPRGRGNRRGWTRHHAPLLRAVGVIGVFLFAASYMVTQYHAPSTSSFRDVAASTTRHQAVQNSFEQTFLKNVQPDKLREFLHAYASVPHVAGTEQDYKTALYTAQQFEKYGIKAEIKEYYPLLSVPKHRRVTIVAPVVQELNLTEGRVDGDACTSDSTALPPFLAYAASGNVTASIVYVNYGRPADFQWLQDQGVDLKGKIALVRYGSNFRGLKVMLAEQHEMAGVLIYSDPLDDGFKHGDVYPAGPWRPADSFQRGSIQYLSLYGGDPLTPGFPSTIDAPYISIKDATAIPHIPALPLSYAQATHILKSLGGKKAPDAWQGGLTLANGAYFIGDDGKTEVNLDLEMDNKVGPVWNVIGTIEGAVEPDQQVLIGNHRDAWVCGAVDPSSGSSALMEIARGFGELLQQGWRPRRTIKLASWDGEEYGLLGSTEYAEDYKESLLKEAVAYINVDNSVGPVVSAGGTPSIAEFLHNTARDVPANNFFGNSSFSSLYEEWVNQRAKLLEQNPAFVKMTLEPDHLISLLGSGTDFTAFYQHLGIISANLAFTGNVMGTYHSTMDSLSYVEHFTDPNYASQASTAKWWGLMTMRLASNPILPFDFSTYGLVMHKDLSDFEEQTKALGLDIDYSGLRDAINHFSANTELFHAKIETFSTSYLAAGDAATEAEHAAATAWNTKLVRLERQFIAEDGLAHRPWYRHVIFGPGFYEGYAGTAFPGIADAIAFHDDAETTQKHVDQLTQIVTAAAEFLVTE